MNLPGYGGYGTMAQPTFIAVGGPTRDPAASVPASGGSAVIDGTPVRVVAITLAAAVGVWALRTAGFRFNVGVSTR